MRLICQIKLTFLNCHFQSKQDKVVRRMPSPSPSNASTNSTTSLVSEGKKSINSGAAKFGKFKLPLFNIVIITESFNMFGYSVVKNEEELLCQMLEQSEFKWTIFLCLTMLFLNLIKSLKNSFVKCFVKNVLKLMMKNNRFKFSREEIFPPNSRRTASTNA
jgi:hypothetical protein